MRKNELYIELPFSTSLGLEAQIRFLQNNRSLFKNKRIKISGVDPDQVRECSYLFEEMGYCVGIEGRLLGTLYLDEKILDSKDHCSVLH